MREPLEQLHVLRFGVWDKWWEIWMLEHRVLLGQQWRWDRTWEGGTDLIWYSQEELPIPSQWETRAVNLPNITCLVSWKLRPGFSVSPAWWQYPSVPQCLSSFVCRWLFACFFIPSVSGDPWFQSPTSRLAGAPGLPSARSPRAMLKWVLLHQELWFRAGEVDEFVLKASLTSRFWLSLLTWEGEIFFWGQSPRISPGTYCYWFLPGQESISTRSLLTGCHMLFYWFTCIDLFMFAVHMSAAFSIIHRNVAQN